MAGRTYSARVMRFRRGVYAHSEITPGCKVLLLRLSDGMSANGIVSIPRAHLAAEFGCDPARVSEWTKQARRHGFLDIVKRARPGMTAVYQGLYVATERVRESAPGEVRNYAPHRGAPERTSPHAQPLEEGCALTTSQEVVTTATSETAHSSHHPDDRRTEEINA